MVSSKPRGWGNSLVSVLLVGIVSLFQVTLAQAPSSTLWSSGEPAAADGQNPPVSDQQAWIVRDPRTGRLYRQQLMSMSVPTVNWETKAVTQTVYESKVTTHSVPSQQTVYTPLTQYVMQPRVRGRWNPFRRPVMSYDYKPVTAWIPQQQTVNRLVSTQQWVPKQQTVYVQQPVQRLQTQQQVVQTEIPQPTFAPTTALAARPLISRPLLSIPILAKQRVLPWSAMGTGVPSANQASFVSTGLRPVSTNAIARLRPSNYSAPMRTASSLAGKRDGMQSGMSATVLR